MKRQIKKSVIVDTQKINRQQPKQQPQQIKQDQKRRSRSRSRDKERKEVVVEKVDANSRRAILMRRKQQEEQQQARQAANRQNEIKIEPTTYEQPSLKEFANNKAPVLSNQRAEAAQRHSNSDSEDSDDVFHNRDRVLRKPVYVSRDVRDTVRQRQEQDQRRLQQQERKHKITRMNTKLILNETVRIYLSQMKAEGEQAQDDDDSESDKASMPDDDDTKDTAMEYELWKIRELKRIRRDKQQRQKFIVLHADVQRRRKMTDQQRLAQNKRLGSDLTDNTESTKYVFMQKYYHKGAFYQDNDDQIFKRDYNLPTPMELQDKSMLPKILQKRKNDFGKKGQSKYQHLTAEDTTNFDPKYRPDETIRIGMQRKMGGYKGAFLNNK